MTLLPADMGLVLYLGLGLGQQSSYINRRDPCSCLCRFGDAVNIMVGVRVIV